MISHTSTAASLALLSQTLPVSWSTPIDPGVPLVSRQASEPAE
jgi:hypothetical protein